MARTKSTNTLQPKDVEPAPHSSASTSRSPSPAQGPLEDSDSTSENPAENSSVPHSRAGSLHPEVADPEAIPEDSVTCQWDDCGIVFTHLPTLIDHIHNEHIGVHKSNYTCEWATCQRRGLPQTSRFALISHIRSHTGEKPFTCPKPECDKSFTRSDALAKHMRLQHNIEPPAPGRGGNRKRKRGPEDPSSSAATMQAQGGSQPSAYPPASGVAGPSGFNTFKVEPRTPSELIDDLTGISQRERDYFGGLGYANGRQQRRSLSPHERLPPSAPFPPSSHGPENSNGNDEGDENASGDLLPEYLAQHFDPKTGLVMGRTPAMVMYLLMKAKQRYALEQHDALMEELGATRMELKKAQDEKEGALNEILISCFGHQAENLIPPIQPTPGVQPVEIQNPPPPPSAPELSYSLSSTSAPPYVNGHGR